MLYVKPVNLVCFSAPGPPSNVTLVSDSQQSIVVFIAEPVPLMRNGIIIGYAVFYRQTNLLPDAGYLSVNTTDSSVTLVNLTVFTEYSVKVAAFTRAGQGNASGVKTIVSQEGGSYLVCFSLYFNEMSKSSMEELTLETSPFQNSLRRFIKKVFCLLADSVQQFVLENNNFVPFFVCCYP